MDKKKTINPKDFETSWVRISNDCECDWCGWFIYRNDSALVVECTQRGLEYYCGEGCEKSRRERLNSKIED